MKIIGVVIWLICGIIICTTLSVEYFILYLLGSGVLAVGLNDGY